VFALGIDVPSGVDSSEFDSLAQQVVASGANADASALPGWHGYAMSFDPPSPGVTLGFLIAHLRCTQSVVKRPWRVQVAGKPNAVLWLYG